MPDSSVSLSERWRLAALEPYADAPATTQEWLRALELGADAAVRVVLGHFRNEDGGAWLTVEGADYVDGLLEPLARSDEHTPRGLSGGPDA